MRYVVSSTNTVNSCLQTSEVMTFVFHVGLPGRRMKKSFRYSSSLSEMGVKYSHFSV